MKTKLKNGTEVPTATLAEVMPKLSGLLNYRAGYLYELVQLCRNPDYFTLPAFEAYMEMLKLAEGQKRVVVSADVRNIVLAAVSCEGMNLTLGSPLPEKEDIDD